MGWAWEQKAHFLPSGNVCKILRDTTDHFNSFHDLGSTKDVRPVMVRCTICWMASIATVFAISHCSSGVWQRESKTRRYPDIKFDLISAAYRRTTDGNMSQCSMTCGKLPTPTSRLRQLVGNSRLKKAPCKGANRFIRSRAGAGT